MTTEPPAPGNDPLDEAFAAALAQFDEQLRDGELPSASAQSEATSVGDEMAAAKATLSLLARAFPRAAKADAVPPPDVRIGRFELIRLLGQGGFGIVYLAYDPKLNRRIALKVPRLHVLGHAALQSRFIREARAGAALDHPHIVPVLEAGVHGPIDYIVSPYCEGPNLAEWLAQAGPVAPRIAAQLVAILATAMEASHQQGVLHRDLKPSNILLTPRTGADPPTAAGELAFVPRITDFGLAKLKEETLAETGSAVLGTLLYMAPEQALAQPDRVGPATDVFSLGVILYELLTGRKPIEAKSLLELLDRIRADACPPPSQSSPGVPRDLDTICRKCMASAPAGRYATAAALAADLQAFLAGRPIAARPAAPAERAVKWVRRHPWAAALMAVVCASAAAITGQQWSHRLQTAGQLAMTQDLQQTVHLREREERLQLMAQTINAASVEVSQSAIQNALGQLAPFDNPADAALREEAGMNLAWDFVLRRISRPRPVSECRHESTVYSVAASSDGRLGASGDAQGTIKIWELSTGRVIRTLAAHEGEVRALEFSPSGDRLASGGQFHWLKLWNTGTWELAAKVDAHDGTVTCLAWHPDGTRLASGGRDHSICVWHATNDLRLQRKIDGRDVIHQAAFTANPATLHWSDKASRLMSLNLEDESAEQVQICVSNSEPYGMAVSPDGKFVLTNRPEIIATDGREYTELDRFGGGRAVVMAPGQPWCAVAAGFGPVMLWRWDRSPRDGFSFRLWPAHSQQIFDLAASADNRFLITAGEDGHARTWSMEEFVQPDGWWVHHRDEEVQDVAFSPDDEWVATATWKGTVALYRARDGKLMRRLDLRDQQFCFGTLGFANDNQTLLVCSGKPHSGILVWNTAGGSDEAPPNDDYRLLETPPIRDLRFTGDGRRMAVCTGDIALWSTSDLQPLQMLPGQHRDDEMIELSPDGRRLAFVRNGEAEAPVVMDLDTGARIELPPIRDSVAAIAFNGNGTQLHVLSVTGDLYVLDVDQARQSAQHHLEIPSTYRRGLTLSLDGQFAAASRTDGQSGEVAFWHLGSQQRILTLDSGHLVAGPVRMSHNGAMLAMASLHTELGSGLMLWHLQTAGRHAK